MDYRKKNDFKKMFLKKGACSHTFFYILNREFGHFYKTEEKATDNLAGGIMQQGYQCGMLWGSSMSVGAEAYRRTGDINKSTYMTIKTTQKIMESYHKHNGSVDCGDVTETDFSKKWQMAKFMIFKSHSCFTLAKKWGPDAIEKANEGLEEYEGVESKKCLSCASELAKKMGATEEQTAMVAGLAGGMGLSGNACGALATAIWLKAIKDSEENPKDKSNMNTTPKELMEDFYKKTDYEMLCKDITGKEFISTDEHTEYLENGGCKELIEHLAGL